MSTSKLLHRLGYADPSSQRPTWRLSEADGEMGLATVAEEVPIALLYNESVYGVLSGTPADLEDLAVGYSVTEGIVCDVAQIRGLSVERTNHGIVIHLAVDPADADRFKAGRASAATDGATAIANALRIPRRLDHTLDFSRAALWRATSELAGPQRLGAETNNVHAAAWANMAGELQLVREDVSRQNALDKALGALLREGRSTHEGFIIVTSPVSGVMAQKVSACGVELMVSLARPTGLGMRMAQSAGVTLVGLVRERSAKVYSVPARIT